jgi:hypothetical protein
MEYVLLRAGESGKMPQDWNKVLEVKVYTRLNDEMKRIVDAALKNKKTITGETREALESLDSHITGANR